MAITKEIVQDKIEVVGEFKHIQVRTATVIKEDGVEISRSFSRHVVAPMRGNLNGLPCLALETARNLRYQVNNAASAFTLA